jgi:hypothetical protein
MPLTPEQSAVMRRELAACLGIDVARVVPEANFFTDLGGSLQTTASRTSRPTAHTGCVAGSRRNWWRAST